MEERRHVDKRGKNYGVSRIFASPKGSSNSNLPHEYIEASITSSLAVRHFRENLDLEFGDKPT